MFNEFTMKMLFKPIMAGVAFGFAGLGLETATAPASAAIVSKVPACTHIKGSGIEFPVELVARRHVITGTITGPVTAIVSMATVISIRGIGIVTRGGFSVRVSRLEPGLRLRLVAIVQRRAGLALATGVRVARITKAA